MRSRDVLRARVQASVSPTRRPAGVGSLVASVVVVACVLLVAACGAGQPQASADPSRSAAAQPTNSTAAAPPPTLSGRWTDEKSNVYEFTSSGTDSYVGEVVAVVGGVCVPINIKVSGASGHYEGTMAFYKVVNATCGDFLGDGSIAIDLVGSGSTAQVRWAGPANGGSCINCTPHKWTRT